MYSLTTNHESVNRPDDWFNPLYCRSSIGSHDFTSSHSTIESSNSRSSHSTIESSNSPSSHSTIESSNSPSSQLVDGSNTYHYGDMYNAIIYNPQNHHKVSNVSIEKLYEQKLLEQKKMEWQKQIEEQNRLSKQKKLAKQKQMDKQKRLEKQMDEQKRLARQKQMNEQNRLDKQKRLKKQKRSDLYQPKLADCHKIAEDTDLPIDYSETVNHVHISPNGDYATMMEQIFSTELIQLKATNNQLIVALHNMFNRMQYLENAVIQLYHNEISYQTKH